LLASAGQYDVCVRSSQRGGGGGVRSQSYPLGECGEYDHRSPPGSPRVNFFPTPSLLSTPAGSNVTDNWLDVSLLAARSSGGSVEGDDTKIPSGAQAGSRGGGIRFSKSSFPSPSRNNNNNTNKPSADDQEAIRNNVGLPHWLSLLFNRRRPLKEPTRNASAAHPPQPSAYGGMATDAAITACDDAQVAGQSSSSSQAARRRLDLGSQQQQQQQQQRPRRCISAPDMPSQDGSSAAAAADVSVGVVDGASDDTTTSSRMRLLDQLLTNVVRADERRGEVMNEADHSEYGPGPPSHSYLSPV